jgi:hypothetical protein
MKRWLLAVALLALPAASRSTTADDLSSRIHIDGDVSEYMADEWVLDPGTAWPESPEDSRWAVNNEIRRVAVTWDSAFIYIAVDCVTWDSGVMAWLQYGAGGIGDLEAAGLFRRNIELGTLRPNILVWGEWRRDVEVARVDAETPFGSVAAAQATTAFAADASGAGAMELALSWEVVRASGGVVALLTAISGRRQAGTGDAAPDPSASLPEIRTARGYLDNVLEITVDADRDGAPDAGVSPVDASVVVPGTAPRVRQYPELDVVPGVRSFAPDLGENVPFSLSADEDTRVFVTAAVYSIDGRRVRELYQAQERTLSAGVNAGAPGDVWDGRDDAGNVVSGGVYVLSVTWAGSAGGQDGVARASVVVVR